MSKITVYRFSPYVVEKKQTSVQAGKEVRVTSEELRSWISTKKIFSHLFRYRESEMLCYDLRLIAKPFASALLLWALATQKSTIIDQKGNRQRVDFFFLLSLFFKFLRDLFKKKTLLKSVQKEAFQLSNSIRLKPHAIDLTKPPVYLRTDFCFALQSGGSIGHIAGVLNHLSHFTAPPIFLTTDLIPTVDPQNETQLLKTGTRFWDFSELPPFDFNHIFLDQALNLIGNRKPSFIYQRYCMNNFSGIKLAHHFQVPLVIEFNGSDVWVNRHWGENILRYESLSEQIELLNLRASDLVVVVSEPLKEELVQKGIDSNRILVNPNGVNPEKYSPSIDGSAIRKKLQLENKTVLGFIGTFGKWHGAEILAEAYGLLLRDFPALRKQIHLLMVGDGMTMPKVKEALVRFGITSEDCTLTGVVPQDEGPHYLASCDILVSPHVPNPDGTPFFGSPTKLFEYMAMGKGIVASKLNQIGEILEHHKTAFMVEPGDVGTLAHGMKTLIEDPSLRSRLGSAARQEVVSKYTWKEHTRKIVEKLTHESR